MAFCARWLQRHQFSRFVIMGGVNTVVTYLIYVALLSIMAYPLAYSVTFALGVILSYLLNARFVFRKRFSLVAALQYPVVYVAQYVMGLGLLYLLVEVFHLSKVVAPILIVFVSVPITYVASRRVIGRDADAGP
jgi:putative flippase GtrA